MSQGSVSSDLLMCGGGVRSILLLPLVARCLETIDVCGSKRHRLQAVELSQRIQTAVQIAMGV